MSSPVKPSFLSQDEEMYVTKRNGEKEIVSFDKIFLKLKFSIVN